MVLRHNKQFSNSKCWAKNKAKYIKKKRISLDVTHPLDSNLEPKGDVITNVFVHQPSSVVLFHDGTAGDTNWPNTSIQDLSINRSSNSTSNHNPSIQQSSKNESSVFKVLQRQAIKYVYYKQFSELISLNVDLSLCVDHCAQLIGVEGYKKKKYS